MTVLYAVINSGFQISGDVDLTKGVLHAIAVPTITSGDLLVRGSFDTTSANFWRIQKSEANSGALTYATGPGSVMVQTRDSMPWMPYVRLELSVAQADTRTMAMLVRQW